MMYAIEWNRKVNGKFQYAMENPIIVTDKLCKAILFTTALEAEEFKEENKLECFTVVEIAKDEILKDMKETLSIMKADAIKNFCKSVVDAKYMGFDITELHNLVDNPLES